MKLVLALSGVATFFTLQWTTGVDDPRGHSLSQAPRTAAERVLPGQLLPASHALASPVGARGIPTEVLNASVKRYCGSCHSDRQKRGNLSLDGYDVAAAAATPDVSEKIIRKLRAEMMPPPGSRRPEGDTLVALAETLEEIIDSSAPINPGNRVFQRLNRPEYERVIRDLLGVEIDASVYLPLDTKSANFDNISDVQSLSPTLLEAYLNAAAAVTRMALGDRNAALTQTTYKTSPFTSQHPWDHVEGTPYGTRGGMVVTHSFPADGLYELKLNIGGGVGFEDVDIDVSVDGAQVALVKYDHDIDSNGSSADAPSGADYLRTEPIRVTAGQHRVSIAFVRKLQGPYEDLIKPHDWSRASNGTGSAGTTEPPFLLDFTLAGPTRVTGLSESPTRRAVFTCRPTGAAAQRTCASQILSRLATRAYRRPLTADDRASLLSFYEQGATADPTDAFESGIALALQAMLASPHFVFRFESLPATAVAGKDYRVSDMELASRLSFFLWGTMPDERLFTLARRSELSNKAVYAREVRRMLADPRAEALATRFAAQWLRLQDIEKVHPDAFLFPDFDLQLATSMQRETELFFADLVRRDASMLDMYTADYTFVNERLAQHYGIPNVAGPEFRRVSYPDDTRRGILAQGSVLVQTSLGNRTSPVLRGKWVMEVLLGMPPPPPPPNIPDLEETQGIKDGKVLTTRQRMELHRANPTCNACHQYMDPIGLALDNFDVTGKLRFRENGTALDTRGTMYDGRAVSTPAELNNSLMSRPIPLVRAFTENLMAYALGRRVEDFDQPTVRLIERDASAAKYKMSAFVLGVVNSPAFRSKRVEAVAADATNDRSSH